MSEPKVYRRQNSYSAAVDEGSSILFVSVDQIRPNRAQPRNRFDTNTMIRLADSVRRYGILQPLTVRVACPSVDSPATMGTVCYELIAGERRLRAAKLAGLTHVPCVLASADDHLSAELAIIENLLREDLNMFEQARAFGRLIVKFSLTQEQIARKMSMSQSAVANKLRLLRLSEAEQRLILENGLTERHARALLRLPSDDTRAQAIQTIVDKQMNVAATEQYIDDLLKHQNCHEKTLDAKIETHSQRDSSVNAIEQESEGPLTGKKKLVLKDLRVFYNSLERAVSILKQTGLASEIEQREETGRVVISISVETPGD